MVACFDGVEEFEHLLVEELNAAAAGRLADFVFVVGAVKIDVSLVAVAAAALIEACFKALEPEDACGDEVGALCFLV